MQTNNYQQRYHKFIKSRPIRMKVKFDGCETHHILPRSLGGSNDPSNKIVLTFKEHWIAHLLLVKCYPKGSIIRSKMMAAVMRMGNRTRMTSKIYQIFRREQAKNMSKRIKKLFTDPKYHEQFLKHRRSKKYRELMSNLKIEKYKKDPTYKKRISETKTFKPYTNPVKSKYELRKTWGNHKKNLANRRICIRCGINETHGCGKDKFRPRCFSCDVDLGKRLVKV